MQLNSVALRVNDVHLYKIKTVNKKTSMFFAVEGSQEQHSHAYREKMLMRKRKKNNKFQSNKSWEFPVDWKNDFGKKLLKENPWHLDVWFECPIINVPISLSIHFCAIKYILRTKMYNERRKFAKIKTDLWFVLHCTKWLLHNAFFFSKKKLFTYTE